MGRWIEVQKLMTSQVIQRQTIRENHERNATLTKKRKAGQDAPESPPAIFRPPQVIPVSSIQRAIQCMQELSKVESRRERVKANEKELFDRTQSAQQVAEKIFTSVPIGHGLSSYDVSVLLQGMGSIARVIRASSPHEIMQRTPLEAEKARAIFEFFNPWENHDEERMDDRDSNV